MSRVLVIDDNPFYRRRLQELFKGRGHDTETAENLDGAVEVASTHKPEVLVVDCMLKDAADGFDVSDRLQIDHPDLKTIVITGYPGPEVDRRREQARVHAFFEKPFDPEELATTVDRAAAEPAN